MATRKQILDNNDNVILPITDTEAVRNPQAIGGTLESRLYYFVTTSALNTALADYTTTANLTMLLNNKTDKTVVVALEGTTIEQVLADNTIYDCGEITTLTITLPSTITADYISQINFTSGSTATQLTAPVTIVWDGDSIDTNGLFVPETNMRYTIMLYSDGSNVLGIVRGTAIPAIQNNNE